MDILLVMALMIGSVLSHVENTRDILANNSLEFRTSPTDVITTLISTSGDVRHMEPDLLITGNILFSDNSALRTTDGEKATTIAGSPSSSGNTVALGQLARFGPITGFRQISMTHVVVVDRDHSCLRLVDRLTLETPWYAGYCGNDGYRQGTSAQFFYPYGIFEDKKRSDMLLVTDRSNYAIRHVQVTVGSGPSSVSQFYRSSTLVDPIGLTQDPISGDLFITTRGHKVFKLTYTTRSLSLLAGSSTGFLDGDFGSCRFSFPRGIILIDNGRKLLLADQINHRLRSLDLFTLQTSSLCTGERGHSDGDMSSCTLNNPNSLMVLNNTLYVGEANAIRKIQDKLVTLCEEREYVFDISPETGLALVKVPGPGGTTRLSLPPGTYPISLDYSPLNCTVVYHVSDHREDACPNLEIQETVTADTGVAVVDVPLCGPRTGEISLPPGSYPLRITSDTFNCTVEYNISDVSDTLNPCSDPVIRQTVSPDTGVALIDMTELGSLGMLILPPGDFAFNVMSDRHSCTVNISISDHRLRRRLVFKARYDVECETTTGNIAKSPLTIIVARHAFDYQGICSADCTRPDDLETEISCKNNTLTVVWPSNLTYTGDVNRIPAELNQRLTSRIIAEGPALYLVLPEANPPIVFPEQEDNGGYMRAELYSYCVGEDVGYVKSKDSCEQHTEPDIPEM